MEHDVIIRKAATSDAAVIAEFNRAMARETEGVHLDPDTVDSGVAHLMRQPEYGFYLVAEVAERVAACLLITYEWSDWRDGVCWWIQSVYVAPEYRRQGIFRRMFGQVESLAQSDASVIGLRLYVEENNTGARRTYESLSMAKTPYHLYEKFF